MPAIHYPKHYPGDEIDCPTEECIDHRYMTWPILRDALKSILEHAEEYAELEDAETMMVRIKEKAINALAIAGVKP